MSLKKLPIVGKEFVDHYSAFCSDMMDETGDAEWKYKLDYLNGTVLENPYKEDTEELTEWDDWQDAIGEIRSDMLSEQITLMKYSDGCLPDSFIKGSFRVISESGEIPYKREYIEDEDIYNYAFNYEHHDHQFVMGCYSHEEIPRNIFLDETYSDATIKGYFDKIQGKTCAELNTPQEYVDYVYGYYLVDFVNKVQGARWEVNHHNDGSNKGVGGKFLFNLEDSNANSV
jgi:hypothetical protein